MDKPLPQRDLPFAPSGLYPETKGAGGSKQLIFGGQDGSWTNVGGCLPSSLSFKVSVHQAEYLQRKSLFLLLSKNQRKPSVCATKASIEILNQNTKEAKSSGSRPSSHSTQDHPYCPEEINVNQITPTQEELSVLIWRKQPPIPKVAPGEKRLQGQEAWLLPAASGSEDKATSP